MMRLIKAKTSFDFLRFQFIAFAISGVMILVGIVSLALQGGPKYGLDFRGGGLVQLRFQQQVSIEAVRQRLRQVGWEESSIQHFGSDREVLIRLDYSPAARLEELGPLVQRGLGQGSQLGPFEVLRTEMVGPAVGKDLRRKGFSAFFLGLVGILIYVWVRYDLAFSVGAIVALFHDAFITIGALSLRGSEFNIPIIAALLTIIGYSVNDTIVIFDRIRENLKLHPRESLPVIVNRSVNETLSRTLITNLTVFAVVVILFIWGGEVLADFSFALLVGAVVGTYSTVFVASPIVVWWQAYAGRRLKFSPAGAARPARGKR